jgi:hypothetical protein
MLKLGGREFDVIDSGTIEWDVTLLNLLSACGLADVTMHDGEDAEGLALRVYRTLMSSGSVFEILGCVLIERNESPLEWNPHKMADTASFIRKLHAPEDKAAITSQITSLVAGFFRQGLLSVRTSPSFSTRLNGATETQPANPLEASSTPSSGSGP